MNVRASAFLIPARRGLLRALVIGCAALAVFAAPAAAAPSPCWKTLLNDWLADGKVDHVYPFPCYHQAISHLPLDVQTYSSAKDDILRALQAAIAASKHQTTTSGGTSSTPTTTTTTTPAKPHRSPISNAIRKLTPGGADAFPLPLLILGLLAILLVLAGLGGMVWRRYQGRRGTA